MEYFVIGFVVVFMWVHVSLVLAFILCQNSRSQQELRPRQPAWIITMAPVNWLHLKRILLNESCAAPKCLCPARTNSKACSTNTVERKKHEVSCCQQLD